MSKMYDVPVFKASKHDVLILQNIISRAKTYYTCNRGPRPSGALFVMKMRNVAEGASAIHGDVVPSIGSESCKEAGCMIIDNHCVRNIHAEVDALLECARYGIPTEGGTMYSINKPCYNCTLAIIAAGVSRIMYAYAVYDEERTENIIKAAGIECIHVNV